MAIFHQTQSRYSVLLKVLAYLISSKVLVISHIARMILLLLHGIVSGIVISSVVYAVGMTKDFERFLAILSFITPLNSAQTSPSFRLQ